MDVPTQLELRLHDQLDIANLLLVSLLFIAIPTPFLNFKFFIYFYMHIMCCVLFKNIKLLAHFETYYAP